MKPCPKCGWYSSDQTCPKCVNLSGWVIGAGSQSSVEEWRLVSSPEPLEHVIDRHGFIWRIIRDGGMATRADSYGIITFGIAALEREAGPLAPIGAGNGSEGTPS